MNIHTYQNTQGDIKVQAWPDLATGKMAVHIMLDSYTCYIILNRDEAFNLMSQLDNVTSKLAKLQETFDSHLWANIDGVYRCQDCLVIKTSGQLEACVS